MTYLCTKCGYRGEQGGTHLKPRGAGQLCHYQPSPLRDITPEERAQMERLFGLDSKPPADAV